LIVKQYKTFTGMNVDLDQFAVNSVMFVQDNPYLIISLDNFGLIVYDLSRFEVGERIAFKDFWGQWGDKFRITHLIPIFDTGLRVLLLNKGSFSLFWDKIIPNKANKKIFNNLYIKNQFVNIKNQIATTLVDYSELSVVQIVLNIQQGGFSDTFVRVYNHMNHDNSKSYKEYYIGRAPRCVFINYSWPKKRIIAIWDSKYYIFNIETLPNVFINTTSNGNIMNTALVAYNNYSSQTIPLKYLRSNTIILSKWVILAIFLSWVWVLLVISRIIYKLISWPIKQEPLYVELEEDPSSNKTM